MPTRKLNRLRNYDYSKNGFYFITICTKGKCALLGKIEEYDAHIVTQINLSEQGVIVENFIKRIPGADKYVIMPNHIHLIISISRNENEQVLASSKLQTIPQIIKTFKTLVTKAIGEKIFQRSYYDHIIRDEADYKKIYNYIDNNPKKWQQDCFYIN